MPVSPVLLLAIPLLYLGAALLPERWFARVPDDRWPLALGVAAMAPLMAIGAAVVLLLYGARVGHFAVGPFDGFALGVRLDALTVVMLLLISGIAATILRFSQRYLKGEPERPRYLRWFLATMSLVSLLVVTNDLLVLALAWTGSGIALHQLLTFYGDRPAALVAAHKKFLVSRVADIAIFAAVFLVWRATGTLEIDRLLSATAIAQSIPASLQAAGMLLAIGVILRSAQLPFHGWLIQVMEAPTPVSAFLHAGIVNIGGFVLIRLAGLVGRLEGAQTLLVLVGATTAVLAALVMTTRVSVKVALAWSTCAQMGFMLLECGLGAYGLALLHLVAHSLYKAHAFLSSGRAVETQQLRRMVSLAPTTKRDWWLGALASGFIVFTTGFAFGLWNETAAGTAAGAFVLVLALAPLFRRGAHAMLMRTMIAIALTAAYVAGHAVFGAIAGNAANISSDHWLSTLRLGFVVAVFLSLYIVQATIAVRPAGALARALYPACFAGFYLDEVCTRLTFQVWPPRTLPMSSIGANHATAALRELAA